MKTFGGGRVVCYLALLAATMTSVKAITFTNNTTIGSGDSNYDGLDIVISNCTVTVDGAHGFSSLWVKAGGILTHSNAIGLDLTVSNDVQVAVGGAINVDGKGYAGGMGPGAGGSAGIPVTGAGGGYGGNGGMSISNAPGGAAYGSFEAPADLGSGGGGDGYSFAGGAGGGAMRIAAGGSFIINGVLSANGLGGTNSRSGGGAGGSIWLAADGMFGSGRITADGGAGEPIQGGGGGGGRIAIECTGNNFTGQLEACGGLGAKNGGAGTIFTQVAAGNGLLTMDNGGRAGTNTPVAVNASMDVVIRGMASAVAAGPWIVGNLTISSNSALTANATYTPSILTVTANGNVTIHAGGGIVTDSLGYPAGTGPAPGRSYNDNASRPCGGGGHGGSGATGSSTNAYGGLGGYDSQTSPAMGGSGGGWYSSYSKGGAGGGVIRLNVAGILQVDGRISANGGSGSGTGGGGGAGGSIWLTSGTLVGSGSITANGGSGAGSAGGGGGGGRVVVYPGSDLFSGVISAYGGGGSNWGGAGTVFIQSEVQDSRLILDNAGHLGTNTPLQSVSYSDLNVLNGAIGAGSSPLSFKNLLVSSNGWLSPYPAPVFILSLSGNATIQAGSGIAADGRGYPAGQGTGTGHSYPSAPAGFPCSGAGHGGYGGSCAGNYAMGGNAYDYTASPTQYGSGGGYYGSFSIGGAGGGAIRLTVNGALQVVGSISANGTGGGGLGGGGGSGGSIWLTVGTLSGGGSITANGGFGAGSIGGGGGGGRISISYNSDSFDGPITAYGGGGATWGGAGTIYLKPGQSVGEVILDNGGNVGTNTTFDSSSAEDVTVSGGAIGQLAGGYLRNLVIRTNGVARTTGQIGAVFATGDVTIDAGGMLSADGAGYAGGTGPGAGSRNTSGGGGHGGFGGSDAAGFGSAYDQITRPGQAGSGGNGSVTANGGTGGGAFQLNVNGGLIINGKISANGRSGGLDSGGGAGGSVWITAGTLAGSGVISADGGSGNGIGGGGGGGRIAVTYNSSVFSGLISAIGGDGSVRGGAGTIYTKANSQKVGQVLVDNGGVSGTNTPLSGVYAFPTSPFDLVVMGGAVVYPQTPLPILNELDIGPDGVLTSLAGQSNLLLAVQGDVNVSLDGAIAANGRGYTQTNGLGAGQSLSGEGSGGGHGGMGGASGSGALGGAIYDWATEPVLRGSGGGAGSGPLVGGSEGGGAIRMVVAGTFNLDGNLTADGNPGLQDDSGGGAGGSIWVRAGAVAGLGLISADGGAGELFGGGGGGGGRIAVYSPINAFIGTASASGGAGATAGDDGTVLFSNSMPVLAVMAQSPTGAVNSAVSYVDLEFNSALDAGTLSVSDVALNTPNGPVSSNDLGVSMEGLSAVRISFPQQTAVGNYTLSVGPDVADILGQTMAEVYTGSFTISLPVVEGRITDTNGQPVAGVTLQADGGMSFTTTDTNGEYALGFVPGSTFTVTPSLGSFVFGPSSRTYTNLVDTVTNEDYLMVSTLVPAVRTSLEATNLVLSWQGLEGETYQAYYSTNLVDWLPYGGPYAGSNGVMQIEAPINGEPVKFFRVQADH